MRNPEISREAPAPWVNAKVPTLKAVGKCKTIFATIFTPKYGAILSGGNLQLQLFPRGEKKVYHLSNDPTLTGPT